MKKIYSLVLMAAVLLIGTNAWAETRYAASAAELEEAWKKAVSGDVIQLTDDVALAHTLWLGTANMNDAAKSITLDLGGKTLTGTAAKDSPTTKMFIITHGELIVRNGNIVQSGTVATKSDYVIFHVCGSTYKTVNAKTALSGYYSHLVIEENVTLTAHSNAIAIDRMATWVNTAIATKGLSTPQALPYNTNVYTTDRGLANGARVDIYGKIFAQKYGIKANGNMGAPASSSTGIARNGYIQNPDGEVAYAIEAGEELLWSPFIYIHKGAKLITTVPSSSAAIAAYSGGYSRWLIEGYCEGSTGVYVKSGQLEIKDAVVKSNYTGEYNAAMVNRTSGVDAGGSGIVMESASAYAGGMDVTVSGTTEVTPTVGYAVDEAVTQPSQETKVNNINIEGGKFHEGEEGTIKVTQVTATAGGSENHVVVISGGTVEGGNNGVAIGDQNLSQFLQGQSESTHAVVVKTDEQGNETVVISSGDAPVQANSVIAKTSGQSCNWISTADTQETLEKNLTLTELQISSADYYQTLIIKEGYKLEVGRVVLGAKAQIVVKPGAKFIVTGEQGLAAYQSRNVVLETEEGNPAIFVFNPAVTSNTHPSATIQFASKSFRNSSSDYAWQRFGIPTYQALESVAAERGGEEIQTAFAAYSYVNKAWENIGYIYKTPAVDLSKMAEPFGYYQMLHNAPYVENNPVIVTMKGALVGNDNPALNVINNSWNGYANSFMGKLSIPELLGMIPNSVDKAIYLYDIDAIHATWEPITYMDETGGEIFPMQPFLIRNTQAAAQVDVNYEAAVYNPTMGIPSNAPARRAMSDITKAKMIVKGEGCTDRVIVAEGAEFTAEFDNGYDAAKYMNDGINLYVSANEKMSNFATDNLENTYVGFQTVNGGNYTIEFANVQGNDLTLIDHETNARIAMVNGSVYEFTAAANSVNDYRFEIVSRDNAPTAIENTEAVKSAKGIYTLTGQYVGEMNVWNTLPAGVYVVNGEKLVK